MRRLPPPFATLVTALALSACAHEAAAAPPAQAPTATAVPAGAPGRPLDEEAAAIEAAKQNPISRPEPRTVYPEQAPPPRPERGLPDKAPPPRDDHSVPTPGPQSQADAPASPAPSAQGREDPPADMDEPETRVVAPQQPPFEPLAEERPAAPYPNYVWAPGYWYWYGGRYVWISGSWVAPRHGYVYVGARWVYRGDGWEFAPGGWAIGFGSPVVDPLYPYYYPRYGWRHYGWRHDGWHDRGGWRGRERYWGDAHRYEPERRYDRSEHRHLDYRPAPIQRHTSSAGGGTHVVTPRDSSTVRRSGDRIRVYPKRH
jgi:hypothetical protein